ncbi:MAG: PAS domain S-box protein [Thermomicrobiales bacterium]|nr:PAS domain S-box protein [Thermomicrobiales bacterium]
MRWTLVERRARPLWRNLGVAMLLVILACLLSNAMEPWFTSAPLVPFYGAVALSVWYGGVSAAVVATLLSFVGYRLFVIGPVGDWTIAPDEAARWVSFVIFTLLLTALSVSRDRAEEELSNSERRFRTMLETANEGVWLFDRAGHTRYANDRMGAMLGVPVGDLATANLLDFVYPEDAAAAREHLAVNLAGRTDQFDFRLRGADGQPLPVLVGTSPLRDRSGRVVGALGLFTDIGDRVEAEQALRLLDEAGRTLASSLDYEETLQRVAWFAVPDLADWCVIDLLDEAGVVHRVAVAHADQADAELAASLMAYPPAAAGDGPEERVIRTGEPFFRARLSPDEVGTGARNADHAARLRDVGVVSAMTLPLLAGAEVYGAMTLATTTASNRQLDDGDFALAEQLARRAAVAIQNARLFREVHLTEVRYRGLFEGTKDGILVFDRNGVCVDANPALSEMSGYSRDELVGHEAAVIAGGGPWAGEEAARLRREGQWHGEFELRRKDGVMIPVETWITTISRAGGPVYVGVLRDESERKRFERMQEEFLSALAHDLKNPLTTVRGQMQLLHRRLDRGEPPDVERLTAALGSIDNATTRMMNLLEELADVMRLRAGQEIDLHRALTDLVAVTRRVSDEHARISEHHQIRVVADVDELIGFWDGARLERVLGNLLGNAIKYSPEGGEITVRLSRQEGVAGPLAVLSVEDRGVGIPARDLGLVFERFRRARNVEHFAGSGIGLAGAKRIVELHHGTIGVASVEGEGSIFTVQLPIVTEKAERVAAGAARGGRARSLAEPS